MGYVIRYSGEEPKTSPKASRFSRLPGLTAAFLLAFLLLTKLFWPAGSDKLREFLLPGDPDVTAGAITALVEDLREGQPVSDSVTAFCAEILAHAEYPD